MIDKLQQMVIERQKEKDLILQDIQEVEKVLLELKDGHYELYGEIESLEHVIDLLN